MMPQLLNVTNILIIIETFLQNRCRITLLQWESKTMTFAML